MPYLEPKDDLKSYQQLLDELDKSEQARMPSDVQDAIIGTESSGDPRAIGDIGAKAGESRGLMQIQKGTAKGLFDKGLLPKKWNGKSVTLKNLPNLLLDPGFNKITGSILYEDNRKVMRQSLKNRGLPHLSPEEEEESLIKMHNQGAPMTLKRDVYGEAPLNPKVQKYHKNVLERMGKSQPVELNEIQKPRFARGGQVGMGLGDNPYSQQQHRDMEEAQAYQQYLASQSGMEPALDVGTASPLDISGQEGDLPSMDDLASMGDLADPKDTIMPIVDPKDPVTKSEPKSAYEELMDRYDAAQAQHKEDRKSATIGDFASQVSKAFAQYGVSKAAADAQAAGGFQFKAPKLDIKATDLVGQLKAPTLDEYVKRTQMMKTLKELEDGGKKVKGQYKTFISEKGDYKDKLVVQLINPYTDKPMGEQKLAKQRRIDYTPVTLLENGVTNQYMVSKAPGPDGKLIKKLIGERGYHEGFVKDEKTGLFRDKRELAAEHQVLVLEAKLKHKINTVDKIDLPKDKEAITKFHGTLRSNKGYAEADDNLSKMDELSRKVERAKTNPIAAAQLGAEIASMYEGGRLTDEDVVRYVKDKRLASIIMNYKEEILKGTFTADLAKKIGSELQHKHRDYKKRIATHIKKEAQKLFPFIEDKRIQVGHLRNWMYPTMFPAPGTTRMIKGNKYIVNNDGNYIKLGKK